MATRDDWRDAGGLVAAKLARDQWRVDRLREVADGWAVAEVLAAFLADSLRPIDACRQEVVVACIGAGPDWADYRRGEKP